MTDRMRDEQLDGEIRAFLAWQAEDIANAPTATEMAMRLNERAGARTVRRGASFGLSWVPTLVLVALLVAAAIGAAFVGARLLRNDSTPVPHGAFVPTGSMMETRIDATATRLPDGRVLVAGG